MAIGRMSLYPVEGSRTEVKLIGKVQARSQYLKSEKMYKQGRGHMIPESFLPNHYKTLQTAGPGRQQPTADQRSIRCLGCNAHC
jgi:hypothetical protein